MYIKVTVFPDFKKEKIEKLPPPLTPPQAGGEQVQQFIMYIREPAERGQANKKVLKVLSELYPNKRIHIVSGALSTKKMIEIK